jgi:hypothetical protein
MTNLQKIRQGIIDRNYYLSSHAEEEMLDDDLERKDVENAILKGWMDKKMTLDIRGTRYRIEGPARKMGSKKNGVKSTVDPSACLTPLPASMSRHNKSLELTEDAGSFS